jgi:hypothetical protein
VDSDGKRKCAATFGHYVNGAYMCTGCSTLIAVTDFKKQHRNAVSYVVGLCDDAANIYLVTDPSISAIVITRDLKVLKRNCSRYTDLTPKEIVTYCSTYLSSVEAAVAAGSVPMFDGVLSVAYLLSVFHHPVRIKPDTSVLHKLSCLSMPVVSDSKIPETPSPSKTVDLPASKSQDLKPKPSVRSTKTRPDRKVRVEDPVSISEGKEVKEKRRHRSSSKRKVTAKTTAVISSDSSSNKQKPPSSTKARMLDAIQASLRPASDSSPEK